MDAAARSQAQSRLVAALRPILPVDSLIWNESRLGAFECDGFTAYRQRPLAVALPSTEEQLVKLLKACKALGVPLVPRGAGTGLSGGAMPVAEGLSLGLSKFNKVLKIDALARTALVQCGVRNLAISEAAAPHGLYYAPDPSSQIACTIGGNVAENAGGVHCLKYGLTLHNILGLRGYTVDGEPIELGSMTGALDGAGPDLLALAIGSEGLLCIVTEVLVKLTPKPALARCLLASFDDVAKAGDAVASLIAAGITPAGLEMMDKPMTAAVEAFVHAGYDLSAAAILLCESDGSPEAVEAELVQMREVLTRCGATRIEVSRDEAERLRFWSGRKNAFPASGRLSPDYLCMDASIPRRKLAEMLLLIESMQTEWGLRCANVFHAGDGNLHPLILFDAKDPDQIRRAEGFGQAILEAAVAMGGSITGEHGVGVEKLGAMCVQFSAEELKAFHAVKAAWDPAGRLNPGKAIPQLSRCAEGGQLWVRGGQLPHPELERFLMDAIIERVKTAAAAKQALELIGSGSKRFYGQPCDGQPWMLSQHPELSGIRAHEPAELYITAGAATPLVALEQHLASHGQMLACEPPCFGGLGTVGGMIATGLSGPARPYAGSVRDNLLGLSLIDGQGQLLKFGGTVIKNVAGFDIARLNVGAMGLLGLITEATFKLSPLPQAGLTLRFEATQADALHAMNRAAGQGFPLSASAWWDGSLLLRLAGSAEAVLAAASQLGGERLPADLAAAFWSGLRHQSDEFFVGAVRAMQAGSGIALWRLSLPSTAPVINAPGEQLVEWGGAQRWLVTPLDGLKLRELAKQAGGQATLYACLDKQVPVFEAPSPVARRILLALKAQFDPVGIFNPGRLWP